MTPERARSRGRRSVLIVILLLVLGGAAAAAYRWVLASSAPETSDDLLYPVREGRLLISVTEAGTVKPREQVVIKSRLEGRTTILYLIPEGTRVAEGELLVELDASNLLDQQVEQEIRVQNSDASFVQSRENLEVVKNQALADKEKAVLTLLFAREDLKKYTEGEYPKEVTELKARIKLGEATLERDTNKLEWSERLFAEKYVSETEVRADRLTAEKAKLDLKLARNNLDLLEDYTRERTVTELESDAKQAEMALERTRRRATADVVQAKAQLRARESEFKQQTAKLEKLVEQIGKAKIMAPTEGLVVYATSAQFSWRGNVEPLAEGQEVRERQELIHLPTAETFMAEVKVHESSLKKISTELPVRITVDALPGRTFVGKVAKIAPLPDAQSMFMNPDLKVYGTEINIDGGGDVLRTGMTCEVEIRIAQYARAMYVPVQCVIRIGGQPTVFVKDGAEMVARPVDIGQDNNRMVHILGGLEPGEKVLLKPPLDAGTHEAESTSEEDAAAGPAAASHAADTAEQAPSGSAADAEPAREGPPRGRRNLTPEQQQQMRERFEKMSPAERDAMRQRMRRQRSQGGGGE